MSGSGTLLVSHGWWNKLPQTFIISAFFLEAVGKDHFPIFQFLEAPAFLGSWPLPASSKLVTGTFLCCLTLALTLLTPSFTCEDPGNDIGLTWTLQDNLPIISILQITSANHILKTTSVKPFLPRKETFTGSRSEYRHSFGTDETSHKRP